MNSKIFMKSCNFPVLQRKSEPLCGKDTTTSTKAAKSATNSTSLSFNGGNKTSKGKPVDLAESSDGEERADVDRENIEADRSQEAMMGEFNSGESSGDTEAVVPINHGR